MKGVNDAVLAAACRRSLRIDRLGFDARCQQEALFQRLLSESPGMAGSDRHGCATTYEEYRDRVPLIDAAQHQRNRALGWQAGGIDLRREARHVRSVRRGELDGALALLAAVPQRDFSEGKWLDMGAVLDPALSRASCPEWLPAARCRGRGGG